MPDCAIPFPVAVQVDGQLDIGFAGFALDRCSACHGSVFRRSACPKSTRIVLRVAAVDRRGTSRPTKIPTSQVPFQHQQTGIDLFIGTNRNPQSVAPVGKLHVSNQNLVRLQEFVHRLMLSTGMAAPDEIGLRRRDIKTDLSQAL